MSSYQLFCSCSSIGHQLQLFILFVPPPSSPSPGKGYLGIFFKGSKVKCHFLDNQMWARIQYIPSQKVILIEVPCKISHKNSFRKPEGNVESKANRKTASPVLPGVLWTQTEIPALVWWCSCQRREINIKTTCGETEREHRRSAVMPGATFCL